MTSGSETVRIEAAPEVIWPWVVDLGKHGEWSPKPYRAELVSGEVGTAGSTWRSVGVIPNDKDHSNDVTVVEVVAPQRMVLTAKDAEGDYRTTFTLTPQGSGTDVTFELVFVQMRGMSKYLLPVLFPLVGRSDMRQRMAKLKALVEGARAT